MSTAPFGIAASASLAIGSAAQNAENVWASRPTLNMPRGAHAADSPAEHKLRQAAAQFESLLLSNLWKSMKSSFASDDDADSADPAHDALEDWGIEAMSSAVGKAGGLGIASLILKHLEPQLSTSQIGKLGSLSKDSSPPADNSP